VRRPRRPRDLVAVARRLVALLLLLGAAAVSLRGTDATPAATAEAGVPVVAAARDLPAGTRLEASSLATLTVPAAAVPDGTVPDPAALAGRVLAGALRRGEPVTDVRLVGPALAVGLPEGQVAAPVRLADLAVAGLVRAGDRVDVLATADGDPSAEVVAAGALVLAVPAPPPDDHAVATDSGLLVLAVERTVAARLAAASAAATLTVSLQVGAPPTLSPP
jgi:Flp pilus assembly protein CpaB